MPALTCPVCRERIAICTVGRQPYCLPCGVEAAREHGGQLVLWAAKEEHHP